MVQVPPPAHPYSSQDEIISATESLFLDMANASEGPLRDAVEQINDRRRLLRAYEAALIPDRAEELRGLKESWDARDIPRLKALLLAYYKRRQDLAPQIVALMNGDGAVH